MKPSNKTFISFRILLIFILLGSLIILFNFVYNTHLSIRTFPKAFGNTKEHRSDTTRTYKFYQLLSLDNWLYNKVKLILEKDECKKYDYWILFPYFSNRSKETEWLFTATSNSYPILYDKIKFNICVINDKIIWIARPESPQKMGLKHLKFKKYFIIKNKKQNDSNKIETLFDDIPVGGGNYEDLCLDKQWSISKDTIIEYFKE